MVPGIVKLVQYSVDDIGPMVAIALPALDWVPCTRANGVTARRRLRGRKDSPGLDSQRVARGSVHAGS